MSLAASGLLSLLVSLVAPPARAADITEALRLEKSGQYEACGRYAAEAIEQGQYSETWRIVLLRTQLACGQYGEALKTLDAALQRYPNSVRLRWIGAEVCRYNKQPERAARLLDEINHLIEAAPWRYGDAESRVVLGQFFLTRGADPKQVLESFFDQAARQAPSFAEPRLASGQLALAKGDYALAAEAFAKAAELDPADPRAHLGLARAYAPSDPERASQAAAQALRCNPNHVDTLLFLADRHIDGERYQQARLLLDKALQVNPRHPLAWAYRAVLAHLHSDLKKAERCREQALRDWPANPAVDWLIGKKLSQKYRFAEGAAFQRRALQADSSYLPAQLQLAQDLLRLGKEQEGWQLAEQVYQRDSYSVVAHNLSTLHEHLRTFRTMRRGGLVVRMDPREAELYGDEALQLLERARATLCAKYQVELDEPLTVEIFPDQADFAIRTFGLPGGAGFLGVCFGPVITMNSPASQGPSPSNWQSVLWHECCHAVTLKKTANKMPRWLSEGISVYEERQADPAWGQSMTPAYRAMILGDELTPVSRLSGAFLAPESPLHLQFAYYESSLVVEYLVKTYGLDTLRQVLDDLGQGVLINDTLQRRAAPLAQLDEQFAAYAKELARQLAPDADFTPLPLPPDAGVDALADWVARHPNQLAALRHYAAALIAQQRWEEAKKPLTRLIELYPEDQGPQNAYAMLATVHRQLGETEQERDVLNRLVARDDEAVDALLRLIELAEQRQDWPAVIKHVRRLLQVDPLHPAPYRALARAAEATGEEQQAIAALRRLLLMDPLDPAEVHYRLGRLLLEQDDLQPALRHTLQALEVAPRFRQAHRQLLAIIERMEQTERGEAAKGRQDSPPAAGEVRERKP